MASTCCLRCFLPPSFFVPSLLNFLFVFSVQVSLKVSLLPSSKLPLFLRVSQLLKLFRSPFLFFSFFSPSSVVRLRFLLPKAAQSSFFRFYVCFSCFSTLWFLTPSLFLFCVFWFFFFYLLFLSFSFFVLLPPFFSSPEALFFLYEACPFSFFFCLLLFSVPLLPSSVSLYSLLSFFSFLFGLPLLSEVCRHHPQVNLLCF